MSPIIFNPNGLLDVSTDPSDLPEQVEGKVAISGAMRRCTNLSLDRMGIASTRKGTRKINMTAISAPSKIIEQGGVRYDFAGASIYENESYIGSGIGLGNWSAILYNPFNMTTQVVYSINGTDRKKVEGSTVYEWGISAPTRSPSVTKGSYWACFTAVDRLGLSQSNWLWTNEAGDESYVNFAWEQAQISGAESIYPETTDYADSFYFETNSGYGVDGKFEIVYTYARYVDGVLICESDPSPAVETQIESQTYVTWEASSDPQVTHVRIYRSLANTAGAWYFAGVYEVGDLSVVITATDDELGTQVATNHDRPPLGHTVIGPSLGGQLFILKDNLLYYSLPLQPEYFPPTYYLEVTAPQFPLQAGCFFGGNLLLASEHEIFLVSGSGASSYFAQPMSAVTGTKSKHCFKAVKGVGVFHLGSDGVYLYTAAQDFSITDANFKVIFEGETKGSLPGLDKDYIANCIMEVWQNKLWFGYPRLGEYYCKDFLVYDLTTKRISHYEYPFAVICLGIDYQNNRLLAGDEDGYIRVLDDEDLTTDFGTIIEWDLQSKEFGQFPKYFPRYARWDIDLTNGASATGEVILDDEIVQTHTITSSRETKKRHVATCTGKRLSVRVHGSGPVDIFGIEVQ